MKNNRRMSVLSMAALLAALAVGAPAVRAAEEAKPSPRPRLKVVSVDSEEKDAENGQASNAVDGDAGTLWHTRWSDENPACPHEIVLEMDRACVIDRFIYLPRQDGNENGTIAGYELYVSRDGKDFGQPVCHGTFGNDKDLKIAKFAATECRFVKLKALSEVNGEAWTSAAELGVLREGEEAPTPAQLKVVSADSEEKDAEDGQASNAVDGDAGTIWHTRWGDENPACPHEVVLEMDRARTIDRFVYLPRQDESENGTIAEYELYVSRDGKDFGQPVCRGTFENDKSRKIVKFAAAECRFVKLKALSEVNGEAWTSAAELGVLQEGETAPPAPPLPEFAEEEAEEGGSGEETVI